MGTPSPSSQDATRLGAQRLLSSFFMFNDNRPRKATPSEQPAIRAPPKSPPVPGSDKSALFASNVLRAVEWYETYFPEVQVCTDGDTFAVTR